MSQKKNIRPSKRLYLIVGTVVCIGLFTLSVKASVVVSPLKNVVSSTVVPVQTGIHKTGNWIVEHIGFLGNFVNIKKENDALRDKVESLDRKVSQMEKEQEELKRLRELLDLSEDYSEYPTVGANVIGRGPGNWFDTLVIDKGEKDGMKEGMNVLAGDGLVGIIVEVQSSSSKVMSVIDDESNISAMSFDTDDICIVRGNETTIDKGYIVVEDIDKNATLKDGDKIVTSNISSKYLPEITIGTIKDIKINDTKLSKSAKLEPAVDFKHLQEVLIIKKRKGEEETKEKKGASSEKVEKEEREISKKEETDER